MQLQSVIRAIYPAQCVACDNMTEIEFGLCSTCWRETQFITGTICDSCGAPLPGDGEGEVLHCDDCMTIARPWDRGRAVLVYEGIGRRLVLGLKHGDRTDLARPAALWMARLAEPMIKENTVIVPVPLHWTRLLRRKYNQAAIIAQNMGGILHRPVVADGLQRPRRTKMLEGHSRDQRFAALDGAVVFHAKRQADLAGKSVLLVDDVMTTGATLAACAEAARAAGAENVCIVTLARVVKDA